MQRSERSDLLRRPLHRLGELLQLRFKALKLCNQFLEMAHFVRFLNQKVLNVLLAPLGLRYDNRSVRAYAGGGGIQ